MPVKARTPKGRRPVLSAALELYRRGAEIIAAGLDEIEEEEGGRRREFSQIDVSLQDVLGRRPWECPIFDAELEGDPPACWASASHDYAGAQRLRRALHQAALDAARRDLG